MIKLEEKFNNFYKKLEEQILDERSYNSYMDEINGVIEHGAVTDEWANDLLKQMYRDKDIPKDSHEQRHLTWLLKKGAFEGQREFENREDWYNNNQLKREEREREINLEVNNFVQKYRDKLVRKDFSDINSENLSYYALEFLVRLLTQKFTIFELWEGGADLKAIYSTIELPPAIPKNLTTNKEDGFSIHFTVKLGDYNAQGYGDENLSIIKAAMSLNKPIQCTFYLNKKEAENNTISISKITCSKTVRELAINILNKYQKDSSWEEKHNNLYQKELENPSHQLYSDEEKALKKEIAYANRRLKSLGLEVGSEVKFTNIDPKAIERINVKELEDKYSSYYGWYAKAVKTGYEYTFTLIGGLKVLFNLPDDEPNSKSGMIYVRDYKKIESIQGVVKKVQTDKDVSPEMILVLDSAEVHFRETTQKSIGDNIKDKLQYVHRARYRINIVFDEATNKYYRVSDKAWERLAKRADDYFEEEIERPKKYSMAVTSNTGIVYANAAMALRLNGYKPNSTKLYNVCSGDTDIYEFGDDWRYATREEIMNSQSLKIDSDRWNRFGFKSIGEDQIALIDDVDELKESLNEDVDAAEDNVITIDCKTFRF